MEKRRRERLEWNRRTLGGAYDKVGKKDPRWDEKARKAMDLAARMFSEQVDPVITLLDVNQPAKAAIDAGCDDPILMYLYNRVSGRAGLSCSPRGDHSTDSSLSQGGSRASRYPAFRRAVALELAGSYTLSPKIRERRVQKGGRARTSTPLLALLPESAGGDEHNEFWETNWLSTLIDLIAGGYRRSSASPRRRRSSEVDAPLAKLPEVKGSSAAPAWRILV